MISIYLFAGVILPNKGAIILTAITGTTFAQGWFLNLTPNHLSNLLIPLVFFVFLEDLKKNQVLISNSVLLFLIFIILYAPFHPIPAS